jgi:hypothetical protein
LRRSPWPKNLPAGPKTLGADKGYDTHDLVMEVRELGITLNRNRPVGAAHAA